MENPDGKKIEHAVILKVASTNIAALTSTGAWSHDRPMPDRVKQQTIEARVRLSGEVLDY